MQNIIDFITNYGDRIAAILLAAHALAILIVNWTPTPKDDNFLAKIYPWIEKVAGLLTKKAKDPGTDK